LCDYIVPTCCVPSSSFHSHCFLIIRISTKLSIMDKTIQQARSAELWAWLPMLLSVVLYAPVVKEGATRANRSTERQNFRCLIRIELYRLVGFRQCSACRPESFTERDDRNFNRVS
jgi:hypothetical protein